MNVVCCHALALVLAPRALPPPRIQELNLDGIKWKGKKLAELQGVGEVQVYSNICNDNGTVQEANSGEGRWGNRRQVVGLAEGYYATRRRRSFLCGRAEG